MTDAEGVQQELQDYLQKKGINTLFINLVESLLLAKPENPISHIIQYLQSNYPDQALPKKTPAAQPNGASTAKEHDASHHHPHPSTYFYAMENCSVYMSYHEISSWQITIRTNPRAKRRMMTTLWAKFARSLNPQDPS
jgi:hypothetical protein